MPINTETLNRQLYKRLSKYKPKPLDAEGNVTPVEDEADVFKFIFSKDGEDYGTVFATIDDNHALTVYYSDEVTDSPAGSTPDIGYDDSWTGLLKQLKSWAMHNQLSWKLKDRSHLEGDMARRNHMNKKDKISEGYHAMGKSRSYSDNIPSVKIVIEHSRQIEEGEQRYRNINKIFLENQMGERFLLDTKKPGIARVYARHIAEGGKVNDERWGHIQGLCEEYQKMAGFVRATRNGQFNESAQKLVNEAINHYQGLRESLSRMTGKRGYEAYFESWTPTLMEDETEETNLNELFVQETLDPRIESVMPILSRLQKRVAEMKEVNELSEWADSLIEGEGGPEASEEPVDGDMGNNNFGGEDGNDAPADNLSEEESLTSNNPIGIPEGMLDTVKKIGSKVFDKLGGGSEEDLLKDLQKKAGIPSHAQHGKPNMAKPNEKEVAKKMHSILSKGKDQGVAEDYSNDDFYRSLVTKEINSARKTGNYLLAAQSLLQGYEMRTYPQLNMVWNTVNKSQELDDQAKEFIEKLAASLNNQGVAEDLDANQKRVGQLGPTEKVKNNNIGKLVGANENFIGMAPQAVAEGLHPMVIADVEKLATLNPADRYSAYANIRDYFKGDPELSKMAADLMGGYYEADMLRGKYKTAEAKAKYAELEPMNQAFIKRALGQEQTVAEGQEDLDTIKRLLGK